MRCLCAPQFVALLFSVFVVFALFVRRVALCKYLLPTFLGRRKIRLFVAYFPGLSVNAFISCLFFSGLIYLFPTFINAFIRCQIASAYCFN